MKVLKHLTLLDFLGGENVADNSFDIWRLLPVYLRWDGNRLHFAFQKYPSRFWGRQN